MHNTLLLLQRPRQERRAHGAHITIIKAHLLSAVCLNVHPNQSPMGMIFQTVPKDFGLVLCNIRKVQYFFPVCCCPGTLPNKLMLAVYQATAGPGSCGRGCKQKQRCAKHTVQRTVHCIDNLMILSMQCFCRAAESCGSSALGGFSI